MTPLIIVGAGGFARETAQAARAAVDAVRAGGLRGFLPLLALTLPALASALASALAA